MSVGIESLKQCILSAGVVAQGVEKILEDGKFSIGDLLKLPPLFRALNEIVVASKSAGPELKDLSPEEIQALLEQLFALIAEVAGKFKTEA